MRKTFSVFGLTLLLLALIDLAVAGLLDWAERNAQLGSLVQYFEYGRSVPGKLRRWEENPGMPGNLYENAWLAASIEASAGDFAAEPTDQGPVVRSYGMSFSASILAHAKELNSSLRVDFHGGPGAPPNFVHAHFVDDRPNRRAGDVVVLGILSSSVVGMAALSNQTWVFEQPAPFTYPVFRQEGEDLQRTEPIIQSAVQLRSLAAEPALAAAWSQQLASEDAFYSAFTHGATWFDSSPLSRLIRRSLARNHIRRIEQQIISGSAYPYAEALSRMVADFAAIARFDEQIPVVILIQTRNPGGPDLLAIMQQALAHSAVPYLATAEHFDPRDPSGFLPDGHYRPEVDRVFALAFLDLIGVAPD